MELSVIIPAYNRERTIAATIDSVIACGVDVQIVVVDDGSTDRTAEVARSHGSRVTVVRRPNAGPAAARNTGIRHATAPVLAFLDSDDTWLPGVVPDCLRALREHPSLDVLFCEAHFGSVAAGYQALSSVAGQGRFTELLTHPLGPDLFALDRDGFVRRMLDRNQVFLGSALIRRAALDAVGHFDEALFGGEDYEICLRLAAACRFAFCPRPLARYEKHPGGLSANPDRMAREFSLAMRSLVRRPDHLTAAERALARRQFRGLAFGYAYRAYDRGDYREARARFAAAFRDGGFAPRVAAYWLACCLPGPLLRRLRRARRGTPVGGMGQTTPVATGHPGERT